MAILPQSSASCIHPCACPPQPAAQFHIRQMSLIQELTDEVLVEKPPEARQVHIEDDMLQPERQRSSNGMFLCD